MRAYILIMRGASKISTPIAWVTAPLRIILQRRLAEVPSHVAIGFESPGVSDEYFEALESTNGFLGPEDISKIQGYLAKHTKAWATKYYLPLTDVQVKMLRTDCAEATHRWSYAHGQLIQQYFYSRFGIPFKTSPNVVTCIEAVARLTKNYDFDFCRALWVRIPDYLSPWDGLEACRTWRLESRKVEPHG